MSWLPPQQRTLRSPSSPVALEHRLHHRDRAAETGTVEKDHVLAAPAVGDQCHVGRDECADAAVLHGDQVHDVTGN